MHKYDALHPRNEKIKDVRLSEHLLETEFPTQPTDYLGTTKSLLGFLVLRTTSQKQGSPIQLRMETTVRGT